MKDPASGSNNLIEAISEVTDVDDESNSGGVIESDQSVATSDSAVIVMMTKVMVLSGKYKDQICCQRVSLQCSFV